MTEFIVTNNNDSGPGSLRDAILLANANGVEDTITFSPALGGTTISLTTGELVISEELIIDGSSVSSLTIDGNDNSRIFEIDDGTDNTITVEIMGLTLTGGNPSSDDNEGNGGAIFNQENLTISDSTVTGNTSFDIGGGIYHTIGILNVFDSTIDNNYSDLGGGGIAIVNSSTVTIDNSFISSNDTNGTGGGILNSNITPNNTLFITNSTISENTSSFGGGISTANGDLLGLNVTISNNIASTNGGGIFSNTNLSDQTTVFINSTISGNIGTDNGGGVFNLQGNTILQNSTITNNGSDLTGGVVSYGDSSTVTTVINTIISGNENNDASFIFGDENSFNSIGGNLIGIGNAIAEDNNAFDQDTDIIGIIDPLLGPLQNNGGLIETHALLSGSLAIDGGDNNNLIDGIISDARGGGFDRIANGTVDIGAFELQEIVDAPFNLDIDGNGVADALTDGILTLRFLFGFTGDSLINDVVGEGAIRTTASQIESFLEEGSNSILDIDGNGVADALTDGILNLRFLFGFTDNSLVDGVIGEGATLTTAGEISDLLTSFLP